MKRPKQIYIFGQKYKINYEYIDETALGETFSSLNIISIRDNMTTDKLIRVLAHEITHATIAESTLLNRKRFTEEEVCDIVGYYVLPLLRANPEMTLFLLQETETDDTTIETTPTIEPTKENTNE